MNNENIQERILSLKKELEKALEGLVKYLQDPGRARIIVQRRDLVNKICAYLDDIIYKIYEVISKTEELNVPAELKSIQDNIYNELKEAIEFLVTIKDKVHELISKEEIKELEEMKRKCSEKVWNAQGYASEICKKLSSGRVMDLSTIRKCNKILGLLMNVIDYVPEVNMLMKKLGEV